MKKSISILFLLCLPVLVLAQGKIFTRKVKLEDFPEKTTKVVTHNSILGMAIQEEISATWLVSAYEFCTEDFYNEQHENSSYYFIYLRTEGNFDCLVLQKGGKEKDPDPLKAGFDVISIPIAPAGGPYDDAIFYMPAFVDILQYFIRDARLSDKTAYSGLASYNGSPTKRMSILQGPAARQAFEEREENTIAEFTVAPGNGGEKAWLYRVGTANHTLFQFKQVQWKNR